MIRRVTREVPVFEAGRAGGGASSDRLATAKPTADAPKVSALKSDAPQADTAGAAAGTVTAAAVGKEPYGAGSLRVGRGATDPAGYTVKGNEDSMLYHTTASPSFEQTIAELWFRDEETAEAAGFSRWD